tara:strand:+ start:598 stop:942 length:345 start_codon:yes stop_codon:yes gene_type:complete
MTASKLQKPERKDVIWTSKEKENHKKDYGCEIIVEDGTMEQVLITAAPSDAFIVTYMHEDKLHRDLTRGGRVNVFDMYYDKFKMGIKSIDYGKGTIKPNLWGYNSSTPQKKKRK